MNSTQDKITLKQSYHLWEPVSLRYSDTDALGHINNVAFAALFEAGRASLLFDGMNAVSPPNTTFVIITLNIQFRAEMHFPGTAEVGTALVCFGNTSVKVMQGIFKGETCCATAESVLVLIDERTRKPIPVPADARAKIERRSVSGGPF